MAIDTVEQAQQALQVGMREAIGDNPDLSEDEIAPDMVVAVLWEIEDAKLAVEFCRRELGFVPQDARRRIEGLPGGKDALRAERSWFV